jgi:hypothetical protein
VSAALLESALRHGLGRVYSAHSTDPRTTDCVRYVVEILEDLYGPLGRTTRRDILISHGDLGRPWSGVEALVRIGAGREVDRPPEGWAFVQRWSGLRDGRIMPGTARGHAFLFRGRDGLIIEASPARGDWCRRVSWEAVSAGQTRIVELR